jgi:hypothetical protein
MIELEISLVKAFGWSLKEIDETDIESLFPFVMHIAWTDAKVPVKKKVFVDQVNWL